MRFIHFGCWNEFGFKMGPSKENPELEQSGLTYTLDQLNKYVNYNPTDFIVIAGDNYYPEKKKKGTLDNHNYNHELFVSGFNALPKTIPKYLIFGNHDIEDQIKLLNPIIDSKFPNLSDITTTQCKLLNLQQFYTSTKKDFITFNEILHIQYNSTLIIMLDTHLFNLFSTSDLDLGCYKYLFDEFKKTNSNGTINQLVDHQINSIIELIKSKSNIKNYVFIGHHPIFTCKHKENNGSKKLKSEVHQGLKHLFSNTELITLLNASSITYLCADLHLYQFGIINLGPLTIKQYVVGTGGAHQDMYDFNGSYNVQFKDIDGISGFNYQVIENYNKLYGFLVVDIDTVGLIDIISYKFNGIDTSLKLEGGFINNRNNIEYININF